MEKGKERAAEEQANAAGAAAANADTVEEGDDEVTVSAVGGKGKRAREERDRRRGTIPYALGEKVLLVGEGSSLHSRIIQLSLLTRTGVNRKFLLRSFTTFNRTGSCHSSSPAGHFIRYASCRTRKVS